MLVVVLVPVVVVEGVDVEERPWKAAIAIAYVATCSSKSTTRC